MKVIKILIIIVFLLGFYSLGSAQSVRKLSTKCPTPNQRTFSTLTMQTDGNINAIPCSGADFLINGVPVSAGSGITGTGVNTRFAIWTSATNITNAPFTFDGTSYQWTDSAGLSDFNMTFTPTIGAGGFTFGDVANQVNFFSLSETTSTSQLAARVITLGDISGVANNTLFSLDDVTSRITVTDNFAAKYRAATPTLNAFNIRSSADSILASLNAINNSSIALGFEAGNFTFTGISNTLVGRRSGRVLTTGGSNTFYGAVTGNSTTTGADNTFIGAAAGNSNVTGSGNILIGVNAASLKTAGDNNVIIGNAAGQGNLIGSRNIFLGFNAGANETNSDRLYIDNTNTSSPLVFGNFSTNAITINGTFTITGDFATSKTIIPSGTTGDAVANTTSGVVNFDVGSAALTVTNSLATANSIIVVTAQTKDATCSSFVVTTKGAGSFAIESVGGNCTAETPVAFFLVN